MRKVKLKELREFAVQALIKSGVSSENAEITADTLITTDMFGVMTHGMRNLGQYIEKMEAGGLDAKAEPSIVCEGPAFAIINGNKALGMVSGCKAMKLAVEKAKKVGIAYVGVKNSCHFGAAGYYANLAAEEGMIGLAMSNTDPVIAVPNGASKAIGTNPFSFACPTGDGKSIFLDIALSSVAALKVIMAKEKGMDIPDTWLVDEDGQPTTDSSLFPQNASLQPMGAHKGYGLAVLVEILSAVITGAGILSEIASWNLDMSSVNNAGHAFIAIDIKQMISQEDFNKRISQVINELKNGPKAKGKDKIFLPGEMEWEKREKAVETGVLEITDAIADNLKSLSEKMEITLNITE
jgi:LDH2 family malate/lactate/ureidoglycolate dehydrogenase